MGSDVGFAEEEEEGPGNKIERNNNTDNQNSEATPRKGNKVGRKKGIRSTTREVHARRRLIEELEDSDSDDCFSNSTVSKHIFEYTNTIYSFIFFTYSLPIGAKETTQCLMLSGWLSTVASHH